MEALEYLYNKVDCATDLRKYVTLRDAQQVDDSAVGQFLLKVFSLAWCYKNQDAVFRPGRIQEILAVCHRRKGGIVRILELGRLIIGTYGLMKPGEFTGSWNERASYFCAFGIESEMQGLGLASLLMADAQLRSLAWELPKMDLKVYKSANKLQDFYKKFGFERDSRGDSTEHDVELLGFSCRLSYEGAIHLLKNLS